MRVLLGKALQDGSIGAWLLESSSGGTATQTATQVLHDAHRDMVSCMIQLGSWLDARGAFLVTGSVDASVRVWALGRGAMKSPGALRQWAACPLPAHPLHVLHGHRGAVRCLAASAALDVVVSGDARGGCMVHSVSKGRLLRFFAHPDGLPIALLQMSAAGDMYVCGEGARDVYMTDLHGLAIRHVADPASSFSTRPLTPSPRAGLASPRVQASDMGAAPITSAAISCILLSSDGALLLTGDAEGQVRIVDARRLKVLRVLPRHGSGSGEGGGHGAVLSMVLSPCENYLAVGTESGELQVYIASLSGPSAAARGPPLQAASPPSP